MAQLLADRGDVLDELEGHIRDEVDELTRHGQTPSEAVEVAIGRFRELRAMTGEIDALGEQLEARKAIDRAKGVLQDEHGLSEQDAFTFIQRTAMSDRSKMREVADRILSGELRP